MSNKDPQLNILWLSDIHYHKEYADKVYHSNLKIYLDGFLLYIKNLQTDYDYILLSGDIAQSGEVEDYELFNTDVLTHLHNLFPSAKLLVVPGNHDVSRNGISFIEDFINSTEKRDAFLKNKKTDFFEVFSPYSNHFTKNSNVSPNSSVTYKEHLLFGYVLDKINKTIIILLNSAWYSVGDIFLEYYINENLSLDKEPKDVIREIKKITSEYGFQTLGLDVINEVQEIVDLLNTYPEFLTITTMHHPINWFVKEDQITVDKNRFHQIKRFTDLLLTGHEHVYLEHPVEYINNGNILHIKAGCFSDFSKEDREKNGVNLLNPFQIQNNWFSTLKINTKKRTVKQVKHYYDINKNQWKEFTDTSYLKLNKKHNVVISDNRLINIKDFVVNNPLNIVEHLFKNDVIRTINQSVFRSSNNIIFLSTQDNISIVSQDIKDFYTSEKFDKLYVVFIDLFNNIGANYIASNNRLLVVNEIKNDYDFKFNVFRHGFFSTLTESEVAIYGDLIFLNKIIPYWEVEHLNC